MNVSKIKITIIKLEIMKILLSKIHTSLKLKQIYKKIVKSHCHLPLYHHVRMNEIYKWLSLYILMIKKWKKIKIKYETIMMMEKWYSMNKSNNKYELL